MLSTLKQNIFLRLPTNLSRLYRICKHYVDRYEGDLNGDMNSNGEMWLARQLCPQATVVFDVGANQGEWSKRVLEFNPKLELHSFEPSAFTFERLRANAPRAIANKFGLSSTVKDGTLYSFGKGHELNSLYERKHVKNAAAAEITPRESERVHLDTIDNYCKSRNIDRIDFLKIDVEGHDLEVLRGADTMLHTKRIGAIQFEYSGCNLDSGLFLAGFFELLQGHGYSLAKLLPHAIRPVPRYDRGLETFRYQNWIAFPSDAPPKVSTRS